MSRKKKILFLIHTLQPGGAEKILVDLVNAMDANKFDVTVMTVCDFGDLKTRLNSNIKYESIFKFKLLKKFVGKQQYGQTISTNQKTSFIKNILISTYKYFWRHVGIEKFYKKHIKNTYDVEVAFLEGIPAKIISGSSNPNSKKIVWIHVDLLNEQKSDSFFKNIDEQKETYKLFDKIVCVSKVVEESFHKKYDVKDKTLVIYNPIDSSSIFEKSLENCNDLEKSRFTFCSVGRLARQKGYDRLLNVADKLNQDGHDYDIWIIGVGSEETSLKVQKELLKVDNVHFLGYKKNPYPYIAAADAFVCSSRAEGFSTVVSEAVVLEKPIVTTDCSGMREILGEHSEFGLICDNNEEALYKSMKRMLTDHNLYEKYKKSVANRKTIFDFNLSVRKIEKFFEEMSQ